MFGFIEKVLVVAMSFFSCSVFNVNSLKYVSMNNQEGKIRLEVISINSNGPLFYPYSNLVRKCNGSCNNINRFHFIFISFHLGFTFYGMCCCNYQQYHLNHQNKRFLTQPSYA